jgi:tRNA U34 5-methylaminomethyl-2-thiouridine-forming methyltransferase MnmC
MEVKIIKTEDGSSSLLNTSLNETYHSIHGAYTESQHVFISNGLDFLVQQGIKQVSIFELGFGTGLNAWLTWQYAEEHDIRILYYTIETHPLPDSIISGLEFEGINKEKSTTSSLKTLHESSWGKYIKISSNFVFYKAEVSLELCEFPEKADVVYYDAFAPNKQPELWQQAPLQKVWDYMNIDGVLTTYCAQGQFRRNLRAVGFEVQTLPGPPGKKEMTRAIKRNDEK